MPKSRAVLSSALDAMFEKEYFKEQSQHAHLTPAENEALLGRRHARLLLDLLLDTGDLVDTKESCS